MDLKSQLLSLKNQSSDLTLTERVELSCRLAKQLEKGGEYEAAYEALSQFWPDRNEPPKLDDLGEPLKALILLRVGSLAGWLGSAHQAGGSQETAKDLISQSLRAFEELGKNEAVAEAHADLALCYWREGGFDEARINLRRALELIENGDTDLKACILIRSGLVERTAGHLNEALRFYEKSVALMDLTTDEAIKGTFHNGYAVLLQHLAAAQDRQDYTDRALIEYAAASFHFEQAGHVRYQGCVDVNVGFILSSLGRFAEAHHHLNRARDLFLSVDDSVHLAQVNDTRARALLSEGRTVEAERRARSAVKTLEKGDERALLAEALTTHGIALARTGNEARARLQLQRAIDVSEIAGDLEGAGRAKLSIIEELGEKLSIKELISIYQSAIALLKNSQAPSTAKRLISCGAQLFAFLEQLQLKDELPDTWEGFSLRRYLREGERTVIERALRDSGGSVSRAARLLGFNHHQSLISLLNTRHKELLKARTTVRKRRRRLVSPPKRTTTEAAAGRKTKQISILHVEDDKQVANVVADILGLEGMEVKTCGHGMTALKWLAGEARFDVVIVDNDLPGLSGLELVRRVRKITHRRKTPIIMLSGADIETEAWRAGVKEFLRKPEDIERVASTVERFLAKAKHKSH